MGTKENITSDVTLVGGGVAGLWSAKELVEQGATVTLVEKAGALASGSTTRNEGWLHAGAYHSVGIDSAEDARKVVERTIYGHEKILEFVPDAVETKESYAIALGAATAELAEERWRSFGVDYTPVPLNKLDKLGINTDGAELACRVQDKSVHSVLVCEALARYLAENGVKIYSNATFTLEDEEPVVSVDDSRLQILSDDIVITAGNGIGALLDAMNSDEVGVRYFKSHLIVTPRLTDVNCFYVNEREAGVMCHGASTIVGFNKDSVEIQSPTMGTIPEKSRLIYDGLLRLLPGAAKYEFDDTRIMHVACVKPDIFFIDSYNNDPNIRQDLNIKILQLKNGMYCAMPGKMTEAPALARAVVEAIASSGNKEIDSRVTIDMPTQIPTIAKRPADLWELSMTG